MQPNTSKATLLITIVTMLFALTASSAIGQDSCTVNTDEFSGDTEVQCEYVDLTVEEQPGERITTSRAMIVSVNDQTVLMFYSQSDSWNFLNTDKAYGLIDGQRAEWSFERIETQTNDYGSVEELHGVVLSRSHLRKIADSDTFRVKVGSAIYDLSNTPIASHAQEVLAKL
jgi:hypothetical protein